jgi:hypothetical protein
MEKTLELAYIIVGDECGQMVQRVCAFRDIQRVIQEIKQEEARLYELNLTMEAEVMLEYSESLKPGDYGYSLWGVIKTLEEAKDSVRGRWEDDRENHWSGNFRYAQKVIAKKGVRIYAKFRIDF